MNRSPAYSTPVFEDQLRIVDDLGDDNFIIQLATIGKQRDEIILAMIPPGETLAATWES
ncbi:MAG: hypothetical protein R3C19_06830 [Planctomycetaceae bacterium]